MKPMALDPQGWQVPALGLDCMGMQEFYGYGDETENLLHTLAR